MPRRPVHTCADPDCAAGKAFDLLGRADVLNVLYLLVHEDPRPWRFGELKERLGLAANILAQRLRVLAEAGLVDRQEFAEMPPRVEYAATRDALEMDDAFTAFARWTARRHKTTLRATPS